MADLIVLESPNKVKDVQKYVEKLGLDAKVAATGGHMLDLPPMAEGVGVDPGTFTAPRLVPRDRNAAAAIQKLRDAIARAERVIVASDGDREGEAIAAQVWQWIPSGRGRRAKFEEITLAGVAAGLEAMVPNLNRAAVEAALARRLIDRLAGWNATSVVFQKLRHHKGISAGRLQSAALRLVVERHRQFINFKPTSTFGVEIIVRGGGGGAFRARLVDQAGADRRFATKAEAEAFAAPKTVGVTGVDAERKEQAPRPPFEATTWLQVAQKALGLSVKDATQATQSLFEGGATTYPRTDSVRVSDEAVDWAQSELLRRFGAQFVPVKPWLHDDGADGVQGAHEAIRPTLSANEGELGARRQGQWGPAYALIEARFLASQAAARVVEQTTIMLSGGGGVSGPGSTPASWQARGEVEIFAGWKTVLQTDAAEEGSGGEKAAPAEVDGGSLPVVQVGEELEVVKAEVVTHTTRPQPLFTQAALVAELKRLGIGRPSTYHSVVPLLLSRAWATEGEAPLAPGAKPSAKRKKKGLPVLVPTLVGCDLADFLKDAFPGLVDYEFTASLERALDQIAAGKRTRLEVGRAWWLRFEAELRIAEGLKPRTPERKDLGACPKCAKEGRAGRLRLIKGVSSKSGKPYEFAGCDTDTREAQACGHTAPSAEGKLLELLPCRECKAAMRPVTRRDGGHSWVCATHGWFLAGRTWELVASPACPPCGKPMIHRERSDTKGEFFWACFEDSAFGDADVFGRLRGEIRVRKAREAGS
jgi:DNA topoisomerase-1